MLLKSTRIFSADFGTNWIVKKWDFTCGKMRRNAPIFSIADEGFSIFAKLKLKTQARMSQYRSKSIQKNQKFHNL